jgi:hypothetical protein
MKTHDLQGVFLPVPAETAFRFIADPANSTKWAHAFKSVDGDTALLRTPGGEVRIGLEVRADGERGTVDWRMTFPDGTEAWAYSRIVPLNVESCVYTFVLTPPPVPLEQLEGTLETQSKQLCEELATLRDILAQVSVT